MKRAVRGLRVTVERALLSCWGGVVTVPVGVILLSNGLEPEVNLVPTDLSLNDKLESSINTSVHRLNWSVNF